MIQYRTFYIFSHNQSELLCYTKFVMLCGGREFDGAVHFVGARPCSSAEWRLTIGQYAQLCDHAASTCRKLKRVESVCAIHALMRTHPDRRAVDALRIYFVLNRGTTVKLGILMETRQQLLMAGGGCVSLSLKLIRILAFVLYTPQRDGFHTTYKHIPLETEQDFCQTR